MMQTICGDCKNYVRANPWAGVCASGGHQTSPGLSCSIDRFKPLDSSRLEPERGAFRQANYSDGSGTLSWGDSTITPYVMRVEVLAIVGPWAMVRRAETLEPRGLLVDGNRCAELNAPFIAQTIHLDFGDAPQ